MEPRLFLDSITPCPWLPEVDRVLDASATRRFGRVRDAEFYHAALCYAQSLWREGFPARALLQLNKSWMAELAGDEPVLSEWRPPYRALVWFLEHRPVGRFLGNPVRHFQHLATRVSGPQRDQRRWRAWACFHLAERVLPPGDYPRDELQAVRESLVIPGESEIVQGLRALGWRGEAGCFAEVLESCAAGRSGTVDRR